MIPKVYFNNQWLSRKGSRDITWLGVETSSFSTEEGFLRYPAGSRFNVHIALCGLMVVIWLS